VVEIGPTSGFNFFTKDKLMIPSDGAILFGCSVKRDARETFAFRRDSKSNSLILWLRSKRFRASRLTSTNKDAPSDRDHQPCSLGEEIKARSVQISTTRVSEEGQVLPSPFGEDDPFTEFLEKVFWKPRCPSREQSLGSGLIIASDG